MKWLKIFAGNLLSWVFFSRSLKPDSHAVTESGSDRGYTLVPSFSAVPLYGWYMLEFSPGERYMPDWSLHVASDSMETSYRMPASHGKMIKRVIRIESCTTLKAVFPSGMRFDKDFSLRAIKVNDRFTLDRINRKLSSDYSSLSPECFEHYNRFFSGQSENSYEGWMRNIEPFLWSDVFEVSESSDVLFSIIMPVFNTKHQWLSAAIQSVIGQSYTSWELIIIDDASTDSGVLAIIEDFTSSDSRIRVIKRFENGHISVASNSGIDGAVGRFVVFLDHDDVLSPYALNELACAYQANPDVSLMYSDEDKVDEEGNRFSPHFKPDFSPETLLSQNYICHLMAIRRDLVMSVGGFRQGFEGSQDYDLLLRLLPVINPDTVVHVSKILYHWRAAEGSTALSPDEKPYSWQAGVRALSDFTRSYLPCYQADYGLQPNTYRLRYTGVMPKVSVIIPTRNRLDLLSACVDSLLSLTVYPDYEIIIVDNDSDDPDAVNYMNNMQSKGVLKVVKVPGEFNFSYINNVGVQHAAGAFLCFMNNDITVISPDWLSELVTQAMLPGIGCVGAKLLYPDNTLQHGGVILGLGGVAGHSHLGINHNESGYFDRMAIAHNVSAVTAACLLVSREIFNSVSGFDEKLKVAFNDVDFCIRVRNLGFRNVWTPHALLYHHESASRGYETSPEKKARFKSESAFMQSRWNEQLVTDPYYNHNFDLGAASYILRSVK